MNGRRFLSVVPKSFKIGAFVVVGCAALAGLVIGYVHVYQQGTALHTMFVKGGLSLLAGCVLAIWLLCLGYVYADARQRAMPPVLWTLVALLVPNLLGFLLYFAMRRPLTITCTSCGRASSPDQPFCSWCGHSQSQSPSSGLGPVTTA